MDNNNKNRDEATLVHHYKKYHQKEVKKLKIWDAFGVFFIEKPQYHSLNIRESFWISELCAEVNIARTIIPKFK